MAATGSTRKGPVSIKDSYERLINLLLERIETFYGERLVSVVLFGSVGRGTYRQDSDVDLLIIARDLPSGRMKRVKEFYEGVERKVEGTLKAMRKEGIFAEVSPVIKTPEEALKGSPLFLDMVEDAVILHDEGGFFRGVLKRLSERLRSMGARRVWMANAWYWDLKPDFKPGDRIEL